MTLIIDLEEIGTEETPKIEKKVPQPEKPKGTTKGEIKRRVLFTMTELTIYPGGNVYPGVTKSWMKDKVYKKKVKKPKKVKTMDTTIGETEEY